MSGKLTAVGAASPVTAAGCAVDAVAALAADGPTVHDR